MLLPSHRAFRECAPLGSWVPVAAKIPLCASVQDLFRALYPSAPRILLESARAHPVTGRYSILVGVPRALFLAKGDRVSLTQSGRQLRLEKDPFLVLEELLRERPVCRMEDFPPFVGGAVGFLGFDAYRYFEKIPSFSVDDLGLPDAGFIFCDEAVVVDHLGEELWAIVLAAPSGDPDREYEKAAQRAQELLTRAIRQPQAIKVPFAADPSPLKSTHTPESFKGMVRRAKEFIAQGEIYQVNLSQRFAAPLAALPWTLYERLSAINPSPFAAFADFDDFQVVSASPERLLRISGDRSETRPIAGTRPRGQTPGETEVLRRELLLNEKERAEHLMLVDLERNDLGRICRYGTVSVDTFMELEEYSHVIHIISNVRGELAGKVNLKEAMAALFPGGTITGCPKVRCLTILEMLEPVRRQLYSGSLGYVSYAGDMDWNLLIRTAFTVGERVYFHAGAGIVADSDPAREYEETLHKAQALFAALHEEKFSDRVASGVV